MSDTTETSEPISAGDLVDQELPDPAGDTADAGDQADGAKADEAAGSVESDTAGDAGEDGDGLA